MKHVIGLRKNGVSRHQDCLAAPAMGARLAGQTKSAVGHAKKLPVTMVALVDTER